MSRRKYTIPLKCAHEGCTERSWTEFDRRADAIEYSRGLLSRPWRCVRHTNPEEVLSIESPRRVTEIVSKRSFSDSGADLGLYFNHWGFMSGPGFKVYASDFPEGTVVRVTAEIVLPTPATGIVAEGQDAQRLGAKPEEPGPQGGAQPSPPHDP